MGTRRSLPTLVGLLFVLTSLPLASPVAAVSPNVVISQVYGGGGNTNATHTHDFVELFNLGPSSASLAGWSVQYASATGTGNFGANSGQITELPNVSLAPGQYYLIQEASGGTNGVALPAPDLVDATPINMGATAGKVALVSSAVSLGCNGGSTPCNATQLAQIVDLIGYGNANFYEGSAPATSGTNSAAVVRRNSCTDTDDNLNDFEQLTPTPRNTSTALSPCPVGRTLSINDVSEDEGNSGTTTVTFTVSLSSAAPATGVTFDIATADGSAQQPGDYTQKSLTAQTIPSGESTYMFTVDVNGDTAGEDDETFLVNVTNVTGATISDGQGQGTIVNDDSTCGLPYTHTYEIQGSGNSAEITGPVTTQGVIVGDFEGATSVGLQGIYLQDVAGGSEATTSDGLFVFTGNTNNNLATGDVVRVTGNAGEFNNQTQVSASSIVACGTEDLPDFIDVTLPVVNANDLERYEGMRVRFPQPLVISEYFQYEQFGEMVLALPLPGEDRAFTPTHLEEPDSPEYHARLSANQRSRITLNDGLANSNPPTVRHPNGAPFSLTNRFRGGDTVQNAVGVLGQRLAAYRIEPTGPADYTAVNPRQASPDPVGGSIQVAAMNTLNFFITADYPTGHPNDNKCGPLQNVECRGHDSDQPTEFTRQRDKLLAALSGLGAEVIGLNELENTPGVDPVGDLVAGLNAREGAGTYGYIDTGVIGTDAIRVGLIYKPGAVTPIGDFQILDSGDDPRFIDTLNRPVLAQTFRQNATGAVFTVAVNHLKSKNASPACLPDSGDGQGSCSEVREAAAKALVDWLASDPTGSGDPDFMIMGDLNSYAMEDPIDAVRAGSDDTHGTGDDYTNLIAQYLGEHAYSFVFDGMAGYLDHALSTNSLTAQVTGATEWHINADEPDILDYDTSFKPTAQDALYESNAYRSSDHDPVIVGLNLTPALGRVTGTGTWTDGAFSFDAQFLKDATVPTGSATLTVPDGTLVSSSYDWLSLSGNRAVFQGIGVFNGTPGYGFLVSVRDGGTPASADSIRVKIWEPDGDVEYDSQPGAPVNAVPTTPLTSGNVAVHKLK
jgi:uncharacterized protein